MSVATLVWLVLVGASKSSPIAVSPNCTDNEDLDASNTAEPKLVSCSVKIICPGEKRKNLCRVMLMWANQKQWMCLWKALHAQFGDKFIDSRSEFGFGYYKGIMGS